MALVLIVDDNRFSRKILKRAISVGGYDILEAEDGLQASELVKTRRPDALITDLLMPKMDGVELLQFLQHHKLALPSLVVSGHMQDAVREQALAAGASSFIRKPFKPQDALDALRAILQDSSPA